MGIGGVTCKYLVLDVSKQTFTTVSVAEGDIHSFLGGRGLAAKLYSRLVAPEVNPLGEGNAIIFYTGLLTGTEVPASTKTSVAAKSPETGIYATSNAGGNFGPLLKRAGFDGLVITGKSKTPIWIQIEDGTVRFHNGVELWGETTSTVCEKLRKQLSKQVSVVSIGPAGERQVRFSSVQSDDRSFGRGGIGAVMGSKRIKAIAVVGSGRLPVADLEALKNTLPELIKKVGLAKKDLTEFGTAQLTELMNYFGCYPTRNFQSAVFEGMDTISAPYMKTNYRVRNKACYRCPIACTKLCEVQDGRFKGTKTDPEYESIWSLGGQCGVNDFSAILRANELCDEYGIDTMSTGYLLGFAMELFERGLITKDDTGGLSLTFGNAAALVEGIQMIVTRQYIGDLLADGVKGILAARPGWGKYLVHVKGMPFAGYDPRGFYGMGLAYGTSNRGACHNVGGWTVSDELVSGKYERFTGDGKARLVKRLQDTRAYIDSLGICTNARKPLGFSDEPQEVILQAVTGLSLTKDLMLIGERIYNLERMLLNRENISRKDDILPLRIMTEPVPGGPAQGRVLDEQTYNRMLAEYYQERGWDENGVVTTQTVERLGLSEFSRSR